MSFKYSASTGCFYPDDVIYHENAIPEDAIEATAEEFAAAMARAPGDTLAVSDGKIVVVPYAGPTLHEAKAAQIATLNAAFRAAGTAPVSFTTAAGATARFSQSDEAKAYLGQCIDAGATAWTLNLWIDASGSPVAPFTFADLQGLAAAFEAAETPAYSDLLAKVADVQAATTVAAVQAVTF
jgi:hypothetical protein